MEIEIYELLMLDAQQPRPWQPWIQEFDASKSGQRVGKLEQTQIISTVYVYLYIYLFVCLFVCLFIYFSIYAFIAYSCRSLYFFICLFHSVSNMFTYASDPSSSNRFQLEPCWILRACEGCHC